LNRTSGNTTAFQRDRNFRVYEGQSSSNIAAFAPLEVPYNQSNWVSELASRFEDLVTLKPGWDGYHGIPVSFSNATFAANLLETLCSEALPAPSLVPGSDGTLQLEWHINGYDLEIDVLGANNVVATRFCHQTDEEDEINLNNDFSELVQWIDELAQIDIAAGPAVA